MECDTPVTMLKHASRTAEAAEVSISIEAVLATLLYALLMRRNVPPFTLIFILSLYRIA